MITISTESVLAGLAALIGCITFLFKLLQNSHTREIQTLTTACDDRLKEKDNTILWLKEELRTSLKTTERATVAAETAVGQRASDQS